MHGSQASVLYGAPTPRWGGLSDATEEGRAFFQERLLLLARTAFFLVLGSIVLVNVMMAVCPLPWRALPLATNGAAFWTLAVWGCAWRVAAGRKLSPSALGAWDIALTTLVSAAISAAILAMPRELRPEHLTLVMTTQLLAARAFVLPSTPQRTAWMGAASVAMVVVAAAAIHRQAPTGPFLPTAFQAAVIEATFGSMSVAVTVFASSALYGLRQQVREALQLGQYTLGEKLGEGGMGVVYKARHAFLRRPTAIKLMASESLGEDCLTRFEREVQMTAMLAHPNTIAIYDFGRTTSGLFYYAMEYLDGLNLDQLVSLDGPQAPGRVVRILVQMCGALAEAHEAGMIHRDVKPANVILCMRGGEPDVAKIVDFGIVKTARGDANATLAGTVMGTPMYMAPESITAPETVDGRADIYAVGALGYYLLSGQPLFEAVGAVGICMLQVTTEPKSPSERARRPVAPALEALLARCLEKERESRPTSMRELRDGLAALDDAQRWNDVDACVWWAAHGKPEVLRRSTSNASASTEVGQRAGLGRTLVGLPRRNGS